MSARITLPSAESRLVKGHHDRIARALADQVEDDLLQQRFDIGRYAGNKRSVIDELQKRGTIRPAKREEIASHGVNWLREDTWIVQETGDLVRFRDTTP